MPLRVLETIVAGCAVGLLLTRPRWGLHLLDVWAARAASPFDSLHEGGGGRSRAH